MCMEKFFTKEFRTPFGTFSGKDVKTFLKTFSNIIKAIVARGLYCLYTLLVVWRVTVALQDQLYWLLLFCIILIGLEALHTIIWQKGGELKWITPSVLFYLICAVPSIWLLELKLLKDRQEEETDPGSSSASSDTSSSTDSVINLNLSDEGWTLAMEQILIFVLVFGKWIAPKGELSRDQLSQLLLVNLGAGADIIELLETFNEDEVRVNTEIVYLVMSVWSWSLLQFCIVPTAYKILPDVEEPIDPEKNSPYSSTTEVTEIRNSDEKESNFDDDIKIENNGGGNVFANVTKSRKHILRSQSEGVAQVLRNKDLNDTGMIKAGSVGSSLGKKGHLMVTNNNEILFSRESEEKLNTIKHADCDEAPLPNGVEQSENKDTGLVLKTINGNYISDVNIDNDIVNDKKKLMNQDSIDPWDHAIIVVHDAEDDLKMDDNISAWLSGRKCFSCFCFYTEIWGMILSLSFQDLPFLITRLFIMFHYKVVSHMTVFFTLKNIVIILLLLNRIRVVILEEHADWKKHMKEVVCVRKRNEEIIREQIRRKKRKNEHKIDVEETPTKNSNGNSTQNGTKIEIVDAEEYTPKVAKQSKKLLRKPKWRFWRV